ncbi:MAG: transposase [Leptospiraceae bacterium]|nr:transposase [Leptospiraceae bacterium]
MTKGPKTRETYTEEFKKDAVNHFISSGKSAKEIASNLGIRKDLLYHWRKNLQFKKGDIMEKKIDPKDIEIQQLQYELSEAKMERDILKKAMAVLSKLQK